MKTAMTDNRHWQLAPAGNAYQLELHTGLQGEPGPGEILVQVHAVSLNYRDVIHLQNQAGRPMDGRVPASDGAGVVLKVGEGVTEWAPGDQVAGNFFQTWLSGRFEMRHHKAALGGTAPGMLAETVVLPASGVVRIPEGYSLAEAATLPCAALTAWTALFARGDLQAGSTVLTLGTGGVSIFALQFANAIGARVIVTSSSDAKLARARTLGAWETVNYKTTPDWDKEVWRLTQQQGVNHVVEVGGPGTLEKSIASVAAGGQIALIGVLTGFGPPTGSLFPLVGKNARLDGIYVGSRTDFQAMNAFLARHQIRPVIDRTFPFHEAPDAFEFLARGEHFGKVVIQVAS